MLNQRLIITFEQKYAFEV